MKIEDARLIDAPIHRVWDRTIDIEGLADWLPTVVASSIKGNGRLTVGSHVNLRQPGMGLATWTVNEITPPNRFVWSRRFLGMKMIARHHLSLSGRLTLNLLEIELEGRLSSFWGLVLRRSIKRALARENAAFKLVCERFV